MEVYFIIKELLILVITIMDKEKRKHALIWIEFTQKPWLVESMHYEESEVEFKYESSSDLAICWVTLGKSVCFLGCLL